MDNLVRQVRAIKTDQVLNETNDKGPGHPQINTYDNEALGPATPVEQLVLCLSGSTCPGNCSPGTQKLVLSLLSKCSPSALHICSTCCLQRSLHLSSTNKSFTHL